MCLIFNISICQFKQTETITKAREKWQNWLKSIGTLKCMNAESTTTAATTTRKNYFDAFIATNSTINILFSSTERIFNQIYSIFFAFKCSIRLAFDIFSSAFASLLTIPLNRFGCYERYFSFSFCISIYSRKTQYLVSFCLKVEKKVKDRFSGKYCVKGREFNILEKFFSSFEAWRERNENKTMHCKFCSFFLRKTLSRYIWGVS